MDNKKSNKTTNKPKKTTKPNKMNNKFNTEQDSNKISTKQLIKSLNVNLKLVGEQKKVAESFHRNAFTFVHGEMGSGKTLSAVVIALGQLIKGEFREIWITRPIVENKKLGALPGDIREKMDPYIFPILQNIGLCVGHDVVDKLLESGLVKIMPVDVAKGCTFNDSVVIMDEYQDSEYEDLRTMMTRLGKSSKMLLCGSKEQISSKIGDRSSFYVAQNLEHTGLVGYITLVNNHRNPILTELLPIMDKSFKDLDIINNNKPNLIKG